MFGSGVVAFVRSGMSDTEDSRFYGFLCLFVGVTNTVCIVSVALGGFVVEPREVE